MLENTSPNLIDYVADAQLVLKKYPINLFLIKKYQFQDKKAVWFIKTSKDLLSLKRYALDEQKWQAMISAYDFLSKKGGNISPLIYTWDNKPWVYSKDYYYILSPWVKGKPANYLNQENVISIAQAAAKIHSLSKISGCLRIPTGRNTWVLGQKKPVENKACFWNIDINRKIFCLKPLQKYI